MTYRGRATFLGVEFCARPRFFGRNLSMIQIMDVEFEADPRFLGVILRKTDNLKSVFEKILISKINLKSFPLKAY